MARMRLGSASAVCCFFLCLGVYFLYPGYAWSVCTVGGCYVCSFETLACFYFCAEGFRSRRSFVYSGESLVDEVS